MKHHYAAVLLTAAFVLPACADETSDPSGDHGGWEFRGYGNPDYPGDGDFTIYMGDDAGEVGCDLWDIIGTQVVGGNASGMPGELVVEAVPVPSSATGWGVVDGSGEVTCTYEWDGNLKLRDAVTGDILMTSNEVFLINGDWSPGTGGINWQVTDYTFRDDSVREPGWWGEKILTAPVHIAWMQDWRRLLIGAGLEGYCGAPGLADAGPLPDHPEG